MKAPQAPPSAKSASIESIQWLRGFAALAVVVFHAASRFDVGFQIGSAGVDVFFVISGFIMQYTTASDAVTPGTFLHRRIARVVPFYWLVTCGTAGAAMVVPSLFPHLKVTLGHVILSLLFISHQAPDGSPFPVIAPGWTLNLEMFFYACFAASMLLARRARAPMLSLAFGGLVLAGALGHPGSLFLKDVTNPLLIEFIAGVWLGRAWLRGALPGLRTGAALVAAGLSGFVLLGASDLDPFGPGRFLLCGVPALLVVSGAVTVEARGGLRTWRPLRRLGDASYSLYLLHPSVIGATLKLTRGLPVAANIVVCVATSVAVALVSEAVLERPLMGVFRRWPLPARAERAARRA
jgi:exopolysaccharide production protein ExoZ